MSFPSKGDGIPTLSLGRTHILARRVVYGRDWGTARSRWWLTVDTWRPLGPGDADLREGRASAIGAERG